MNFKYIFMIFRKWMEINRIDTIIITGNNTGVIIV